MRRYNGWQWRQSDRNSPVGKSDGPWPNRGVQRYTLYRSAPGKRKKRPPLAPALLVLVVGALVWLRLNSRDNRGRHAPDMARSTGSFRIEKPDGTALPKSGFRSIDTRSSTTRTASTTTTMRPDAPAAMPPQTPVDTNHVPRSPQNVLEAQLALARVGISPGSLDGVPGSRTRLALIAFQQKENLPVTGALDAPTR